MRKFWQRSAGFVAIIIIGFGLTTPSAFAQRDGGPTAGDFTGADGLDITGYLSAVAEFETAPSVTAGGALAVVADDDCAGTVTISLVSPDANLGSFPASPTGTYAVTIPAGIDSGYSRVRVTCTSVLGATLVFDEAVNVVTGGGVASVVIADDAAPTTTTGSGSGSLAFTGNDTAQMLGYATALVLVGAAALGFGSRARRRTPAGKQR